jgi:hypothetical protein
LNVRAQLRPLLTSENHDGDFPTCEVLLMAHVLVCGQQDIESALFRRRQQIDIAQRIPSLLRSCADNVLIEISADR